MGCDNNFSVLAKPDPSLSQAEETLIFPPEKYQSSGSKLTDAGIYNFVVQDPVYIVQDPVHIVQDPVYCVSIRSFSHGSGCDVDRGWWWMSWC